MSKNQYALNTTDSAIVFPTLEPPLVIPPGEIRGLPGDVTLPPGLTKAKAADYKPADDDAPSSPPVSDYPPVDPEPAEPDVWFGEPAQVFEETVDNPALIDGEPDPNPILPLDTVPAV